MNKTTFEQLNRYDRFTHSGIYYIKINNTNAMCIRDGEFLKFLNTQVCRKITYKLNVKKSGDKCLQLK